MTINWWCVCWPLTCISIGTEQDWSFRTTHCSTPNSRSGLRLRNWGGGGLRQQCLVNIRRETAGTDVQLSIYSVDGSQRIWQKRKCDGIRDHEDKSLSLSRSPYHANRASNPCIISRESWAEPASRLLLSWLFCHPFMNPMPSLLSQLKHASLLSRLSHASLLFRFQHASLLSQLQHE
jgi:hypothetical protein